MSRPVKRVAPRQDSTSEDVFAEDVRETLRSCDVPARWHEDDIAYWIAMFAWYPSLYLTPPKPVKNFVPVSDDPLASVHAAVMALVEIDPLEELRKTSFPKCSMLFAELYAESPDAFLRVLTKLRKLWSRLLSLPVEEVAVELWARLDEGIWDVEAKPLAVALSKLLWRAERHEIATKTVEKARARMRKAKPFELS